MSGSANPEKCGSNDSALLIEERITPPQQSPTRKQSKGKNGKKGKGGKKGGKGKTFDGTKGKGKSKNGQIVAGQHTANRFASRLHQQPLQQMPSASPVLVDTAAGSSNVNPKSELFPERKNRFRERSKSGSSDGLTTSVQQNGRPLAAPLGISAAAQPEVQNYGFSETIQTIVDGVSALGGSSGSNSNPQGYVVRSVSALPKSPPQPKPIFVHSAVPFTSTTSPRSGTGYIQPKDSHSNDTPPEITESESSIPNPLATPIPSSNSKSSIASDKQDVRLEKENVTEDKTKELASVPVGDSAVPESLLQVLRSSNATSSNQKVSDSGSKQIQVEKVFESKAEVLEPIPQIDFQQRLNQVQAIFQAKVDKQKLESTTPAPPLPVKPVIGQSPPKPKEQSEPFDEEICDEETPQNTSQPSSSSTDQSSTIKSSGSCSSKLSSVISPIPPDATQQKLQESLPDNVQQESSFEREVISPVQPQEYVKEESSIEQDITLPEPAQAPPIRTAVSSSSTSKPVEELSSPVPTPVHVPQYVSSPPSLRNDGQPVRKEGGSGSGTGIWGMAKKIISAFTPRVRKKSLLDQIRICERKWIAESKTIAQDRFAGDNDRYQAAIKVGFMTMEGIGCRKPEKGTQAAKEARKEADKWFRVGVELGSREAHRHLRYLLRHKEWLGGDPSLDATIEWIPPEERITPPGVNVWVSWSDEKIITRLENGESSRSPSPSSGRLVKNGSNDNNRNANSNTIAMSALLQAQKSIRNAGSAPVIEYEPNNESRFKSTSSASSLGSKTSSRDRVQVQKHSNASSRRGSGEGNRRMSENFLAFRPAAVNTNNTEAAPPNHLAKPHSAHGAPPRPKPDVAPQSPKSPGKPTVSMI